MEKKATIRSTYFVRLLNDSLLLFQQFIGHDFRRDESLGQRFDV